MAEIQLFQLIFEQFLKVDPSILSQYVTVQDQLLYIILIPHVILLLFLWNFGAWISRGSARFNMLISLVGYIYIIASGLYGTFFIPIIVNFFALMIILSFGFFILTYIIHPARGPALFRLTGELGKEIGEKTVGKSKRKKEISRQIDDINAQIGALRRRLGHGRSSDSFVNIQITELERRKAELERQLE